MKQLVLLLSILSAALGYKILCVTPMPSKSHSTLGKGIVSSLLNAGHEVTWLTPFPDMLKHKNLKMIDGSATIELTGDINMMEKSDTPPSFLLEFANNVSSMTANNKELRQELVTKQYDAVVTEWFMTDVDAGYAAVQQVPWIVLTGMHLMPHTENFIDDIRTISTVPILMNDYPTPMNFIQRVSNTMLFALMWITEQMDFPNQEARYKSLFEPLAEARGVKLPPLRDAINVSVLFLNSHPSISPAVSLPPNAVEIAGYHIDETTPPLPKDIQEHLDNSPQGVVYFSMGSVLKSASMPEHTRRALIAMFSEIPYTVFWKFEEDIQGLPNNIIVRKWWPQASVLAHPNVRLFITHGGLLSKLEAVRYGVPLLAVPVFGDQPSNAASAQRAGFARLVPYSEHMADELKATLNHMLKDDRYYKQAKYLSKMFNNRLVHPSKLVSHYVELAIESKGAGHLRSKSHLYPWYQRWMLDQLAALLLIMYVAYVLVKKIVCYVFCKQKQANKKVKKN